MPWASAAMTAMVAGPAGAASSTEKVSVMESKRPSLGSACRVGERWLSRKVVLTGR